MSSGRYMAYSPSPSAPPSPHIGGLRSSATALVEHEKYAFLLSSTLSNHLSIDLYLSELLAERNKLNPFMPVLPQCCRLLNQDQKPSDEVVEERLHKEREWAAA
ncbi:hypothetical protein RHMOL_Rhmol06G0317500 [Rhododendron molle]|uniref:Uncharacterized protein n=1 Tax=Rhododendron molle TaxID=49168 RepID=A0ACC0NJL1_RHOML|nr:hypothetical protein RHMOL_Rhmol06G0317500 [Rhododendron molle]